MSRSRLDVVWRRMSDGVHEGFDPPPCSEWRNRIDRTEYIIEENNICDEKESFYFDLG